MKTILITAVGFAIALTLSQLGQPDTTTKKPGIGKIDSATISAVVPPVNVSAAAAPEKTAPAADPITPVETPQPVAAAAPVDKPWVVTQTVHGVHPDSINNALAVFKGIGLTKEGAAFIVGNYAQESAHAFTDPCVSFGDGGLALGFGQWHPARRVDMPCTVNAQLIWSVDVEMPRDALHNGYVSLSDRLKSNDIADIKNGIKRWERYGYEGNRFLYGQQIYDEIK
jgi:hypothetical protein